MEPPHLILTKPLPCFVCGKELETAFKGSDYLEQPSGAVMCTTYGNYGSTAFDSINGTKLEFNICDACLVERAARVKESRYAKAEPVEVFSRFWSPETGAGE